MPVLTSYKGLDVVEGATGAGGIAITDDFKELADRAAMRSDVDPDEDNDEDEGYFPGSLWFNEATETMWICVDATDGSAVWKSFYKRTSTALALIPEESGDAVMVTGKLAVGTADPKANLHATESTIVGADADPVGNGDLAPGEVNIWLDESSPGSEKLKFKVKLSGGSVKTGEISLS